MLKYPLYLRYTMTGTLRYFPIVLSMILLCFWVPLHAQTDADSLQTTTQITEESNDSFEESASGLIYDHEKQELISLSKWRKTILGMAVAHSTAHRYRFCTTFQRSAYRFSFRYFLRCFYLEWISIQ